MKLGWLVLKIFLSAAEASSDIHGAELIKALRKEAPEIEFFGVGGPQLQAAGLRKIVDSRELLVMGFSEVFFHLSQILKILKKLIHVIEEEKPHALIVIDYPDFHFRLIKKLHNKLKNTPRFYYVPPKIWVWRKKRAEFLRRYFDCLLLIFPFEVPFYEKLKLPARYVGNPLMDELPLHLTQAEARQQLHLDSSSNTPIVVLMPGSRPAELKTHLPVMLSAAYAASQELQVKFKILMPFPETAKMETLTAQVEEWKKNTHCELDIHLFQGNSALCLLAADFGLIKSGTSTLEAGLLDCPHSIVYKAHPLSVWIFNHIIRYRGPVGLVNLVYGWTEGDKNYLVPEILSEQVTEENLKKELLSLYLDETKRAKMKLGFQRIRTQLKVVPGESPSQTAAKEILLWIRSRQSAFVQHSGVSSTDTSENTLHHSLKDPLKNPSKNSPKNSPKNSQGV